MENLSVSSTRELEQPALLSHLLVQTKLETPLLLWLLTHPPLKMFWLIILFNPVSQCPTTEVLLEDLLEDLHSSVALLFAALFVSVSAVEQDKDIMFPHLLLLLVDTLVVITPLRFTHNMDLDTLEVMDHLVVTNTLDLPILVVTPVVTNTLDLLLVATNITKQFRFSLIDTF
jgi:hypothetical protein